MMILNSPSSPASSPVPESGTTNTDSAGASNLAEMMRKGVLERAPEHAGSATHSHVTISLGVATMVPGVDEPVQKLVDLADAALYEAKSAGRNRFVVKQR